MMELLIEKLSQVEYRKVQRYRLGLTQVQIAKKLGFSTIFYQLWETGKRHSAKLEAQFEALIAKHNRSIKPPSPFRRRAGDEVKTSRI